MSYTKFQECLHKVCAANEWVVQPFGESFKVTVKINHIEKDVLVTFIDDEKSGDSWARFWSEGCRVGILDNDFLLKLNAEDRFPTGAVAVKKNRVVAVNSQLTSTADDIEVLSCLKETAKLGLALKRLADQAVAGSGTGRFVRSKLFNPQSDPRVPTINAKPKED